MSVSIVIPVFNAAPGLPELVHRLAEAKEQRGSFTLGEVIFVDDGSADRSPEILNGLIAPYEWCTLIRLSRNFGQHAATLAGIARSSGGVLVTMDDDLQHRPEEVAALVGAISDGADLVYGQAVDEEHDAWRNVTSRLSKRLIGAAASSPHARHVSGFRAFRRDLVPGLLMHRGPFVSLDVALLWQTDRVAVVPVDMDQRRHGRSNYSVGRLVRHALNMFLGLTTVPLRIVSWIGMAASLVGIGLFAYVLVRFALTGATVPGFAFLASSITLFAGLQLLALGVLGEYVARLYLGSLNKPAYVERHLPEGERDGLG